MPVCSLSKLNLCCIHHCDFIRSCLLIILKHFLCRNITLLYLTFYTRKSRLKHERVGCSSCFCHEWLNESCILLWIALKEKAWKREQLSDQKTCRSFNWIPSLHGMRNSLSIRKGNKQLTDWKVLTPHAPYCKSKHTFFWDKAIHYHPIAHMAFCVVVWITAFLAVVSEHTCHISNEFNGICHFIEKCHRIRNWYFWQRPCFSLNTAHS